MAKWHYAPWFNNVVLSGAVVGDPELRTKKLDGQDCNILAFSLVSTTRLHRTRRIKLKVYYIDKKLVWHPRLRHGVTVLVRGEIVSHTFKVEGRQLKTVSLLADRITRMWPPPFREFQETPAPAQNPQMLLRNKHDEQEEEEFEEDREAEAEGEGEAEEQAEAEG